MIERIWKCLRAGYWRNGEQRCLADPVCERLRRELAAVGKEFEAMPYERLLEPAEELSFSRVVDGIEVSFSAEAYDVKKNGDICFCIDARARLNRTGWQPSYRFVKRKDGTVCH